MVRSLTRRCHGVMFTNTIQAAPITSRTETLQKYLALDQKGMIMAEYVWVDADGGTRSKSRVSANSSLCDFTMLAMGPSRLPFQSRSHSLHVGKCMAPRPVGSVWAVLVYAGRKERWQMRHDISEHR